jgi:hypothetical protein
VFSSSPRRRRRRCLGRRAPVFLSRPFFPDAAAHTRHRAIAPPKEEGPRRTHYTYLSLFSRSLLPPLCPPPPPKDGAASRSFSSRRPLNVCPALENQPPTHEESERSPRMEKVTKTRRREQTRGRPTIPPPPLPMCRAAPAAAARAPRTKNEIRTNTHKQSLRALPVTRKTPLPHSHITIVGLGSRFRPRAAPWPAR